MKKVRHWKFRTQLISLFAISAISFSIIGSIVGSVQVQRAERHHILDQSLVLVKAFAKQSVLALLFGNGENVAAESKIITSFPDVDYLAIINQSNQIIYSAGSEQLLPGPVLALAEHSSQNYLLETEDNWVIAEPVYSNLSAPNNSSPFGLDEIDPEYLGYVVLVISKKGLKKLVAGSFNDSLLATLTLSLILFFIVFMFTDKIIQPINRLAKIMLRAKSGEGNLRAPMNHVSEEIYNMGQAFNTMMKVLEDRSERLDKQNQMLSNEMAEKRLAEEQNMSLQRQLMQAQKMDAIGQLTGGIAHDFNNILASILGYALLASERAKKGSDGKLSEYLDEIQIAGNRAKELVAQMMQFSRAGAAEEFSTRASLVSLSIIVDDVLKMLKAILPSSIEINVQVEADLPQVMASPVQVHQMIMNLCINARDAMHGKGQVNIHLQEKKNEEFVCHSCLQAVKGDFAAVTIEDDGNGIPPEIAERVFQPFFTTKEVGRGTGMGLSMVHGIIHEHSGHIQLHSEPNKGTRFTLYFPQAASDSDEKIIDAESSRRAKKHIYLVTEGNTVLQLVNELLLSKGYQVTSQNSFSNLEKNAETLLSTCDLLLLGDGKEQQISNKFIYSMLNHNFSLPIILCLRKTDDARRDSLLHSGVTSIYDGTVDPVVLLKDIESVLDSSTSGVLVPFKQKVN